MKNNVFACILFTSVVVILFACNKNSTNLPTDAKSVTLNLPAQSFVYNTTNNNLNNDKATLGRVLFYDNHLSINNSVSCASCHKQANSFADNVEKSIGYNGQKTLRNSLPVQNLVFNSISKKYPDSSANNNLFWDGREANINQISLGPLGNHIEMGITNFDHLSEKLNALPYYKSLSEKAFGSANLTARNISIALANFCASIKTNNSKVDKARLNPSNNTMSALELSGQALFNSETYKCISCHGSVNAAASINTGGGTYYGGSVLNDASLTANIGLDKNVIDIGLQGLSAKGGDAGKFKMPDLHNVALTAPYMHDGRFKTLEEVLDHYSTGICEVPNLDWRLQDKTGLAKKMNITPADKAALIAFLNALTCYDVLYEEKYSNPFLYK
jgi:cytochrome c peroxidase